MNRAGMDVNNRRRWRILDTMAPVARRLESVMGSERSSARPLWLRVTDSNFISLLPVSHFCPNPPSSPFANSEL